MPKQEICAFIAALGTGVAQPDGAAGTKQNAPVRTEPRHSPPKLLFRKHQSTVFMLNELLPPLRGTPRKSFRSYGSAEASVKIVGMRETLREGKRVKEGPGNQGGTGQPPSSRAGRLRMPPGSRSRIPDPRSRSRPHLRLSLSLRLRVRHSPRARTAALPRHWPVRTRVPLRPRRAPRARRRGACREL